MCPWRLPTPRLCVPGVSLRAPVQPRPRRSPGCWALSKVLRQRHRDASAEGAQRQHKALGPGVHSVANSVRSFTVFSKDMSAKGTVWLCVWNSV